MYIYASTYSCLCSMYARLYACMHVVPTHVRICPCMRTYMYVPSCTGCYCMILYAQKCARAYTFGVGCTLLRRVLSVFCMCKVWAWTYPFGVGGTLLRRVGTAILISKVEKDGTGFEDLHRNSSVHTHCVKEWYVHGATPLKLLFCSSSFFGIRGPWRMHVSCSQYVLE